MVEITLPALGGREVHHGDETWELTGEVDVLADGDTLEAEARQADDVRHRRAHLRFGLEDPPKSLNPGNLGENFERLERDDGDYTLVVKTAGRTYRYELDSIEYE